MRISKGDRDINFYISLSENENPGKLKARRSSNAVFLLCAMILGSVLIIYVFAWNENAAVEREIKDNTAYIEDENNVKKYNDKLAIKQKSKKIEDYNQASAQYLKQLKESARFSQHWIDYFTGEMEKAIGEGSEITNYSYFGNVLELTCETDDEKKPKLFAQHLTELKDKDGSPLFANVVYTGFAKQGGTGDTGLYGYSLTITLWVVEESIEVETEQASESQVQSETTQ